MPLKDKDAKRAYYREYMKQRLAVDAEFREKHYARTKRNNERYHLEIDALIREFRTSGCCICGERDLR